MSSTVPEDEDLYDPYEQRAMGDLAPVVSWKKSDPGDYFTGVLLPADPVKRPDKGYALKREYKQANPKEGQQAGYTVWPPKNNVEQIKRPVVESEFVTRWPNEDLSKARKVSQVHLTFETGLTDGSLISSQAKERMVENDKQPNEETRRRLIEQGEDLTQKIAAALKPVGGKPLPGQTWRVAIKSRVPNDYGGETTIYDVQIAPPTEQTRAVVVAYVEAAVAKANAEADASDPADPYVGGAAKVSAPAGDPWAAGPQAAQTAEPPF